MNYIKIRQSEFIVMTNKVVLEESLVLKIASKSQYFKSYFYETFY